MERETDDGTDRRLIARIAARDRAAFDLFYRSYARRVLAFIRDIVRSNELAEEAAGDALIAVWRDAGRYRGDCRVITWALAIAHHKAIDALRRLPRETVAGPAVDDATTGDVFERCDDRLALDAAIRTLSLEHRTVLELMYGFGCSQAEIAAIVGCPPATVKTRVFYAKRNLRDELERAGKAEELA